MQKNVVHIYNETEEQIQELNQVNKVLLYALKKEKFKQTEFNLIFVDQETIRNLNRKYRNIDKETDVITFALEEDQIVVLPKNIRILGDIYISLPQAKQQATLYGHSLLRELSFLAVHGFYHLLGYDHETKEQEKEMFQKQEELLKEMKITR